MSFWKKALFANSKVFLILIGVSIIFALTPAGRPVGKVLVLLPEVVPSVPVKPLRFLSKEPVVEEVKIKTSNEEVMADIYRPNDNRRHPAIIFSLGTIISRKDETVVRITEALARSGFVVLTPDIPDLISGFVWPDSVRILVSSVEYLDNQPYVKRDKIGFAGFCVGSSASILAAQNPKIADKVAFVSAISPYFNLITLSEAVVTKQADNGQGKFEPWNPDQLSVKSVQKGFINYIADRKEREILYRHFLENRKINQEQINGFSNEAKSIYEFLANSDGSQRAEIWASFPQEGKDLLTELSPSADISSLKAKLFVLNDKNDTYVPKIEGVRLAESLPKDQIYFVEVDSFEHVNPATSLPRWAAIKQLFNVGRYLYNVFSEVS